MKNKLWSDKVLWKSCLPQLMTMGLQYFAEGEEGTDPDGQGGEEEGGGAAGSEDEKGAKGKPKAKYTDEDVDKIINARFARWQKEQDEKISEAQKLAEMNAQQKAEYERDKLQKELDELRNANTLTEMKNTSRGILREAGINIPDELLSSFVSTDAEQTKEAVDSFIALFNKAVQDGIAEKLKGHAPKKGTPGGSTITKEQIMAISDTRERQRMIAEHKELFIK